MSTVATKERPILFSGPMVRAILDGRKTQTRRVVTGAGWLARLAGSEARSDHAANLRQIACGCPFGVEGDRLWVRETWTTRGRHTRDYPIAEIVCNRAHFEIWYAADCYKDGRELFNLDHLSGRWRPAIHMPRALCRLVLEVTDVRVERLQAITDDDARAEGCDGEILGQGGVRISVQPRTEYAVLWNTLNAARGYGWDANPWVGVIGFRRIDA